MFCGFLWHLRLRNWHEFQSSKSFNCKNSMISLPVVLSTEPTPRLFSMRGFRAMWYKDQVNSSVVVLWPATNMVSNWSRSSDWVKLRWVKGHLVFIKWCNLAVGTNVCFFEEKKTGWTFTTSPAVRGVTPDFLSQKILYYNEKHRVWGCGKLSEDPVCCPDLTASMISSNIPSNFVSCLGWSETTHANQHPGAARWPFKPTFSCAQHILSSNKRVSNGFQKCKSGWKSRKLLWCRFCTWHHSLQDNASIVVSPATAVRPIRAAKAP